ncbi:OsmC family protein [Paraburkholderia caballeronis]|uniref:Putative redox protein n=1 Tax=Paraburkholderia caballeronis TaxID=416943 RepID=A0A1H7RJP4_9BURK|nr:OsmC family protein [Paraburkholderia caballeronis]PXW23073.1 putative redox protein [Paraburkholderia caballeronis]PXW97737.1 putative redox protein [Paraburkholderia caballeronis]RAJ94707.1 putative redox protein [Paraburkholderia caballeronis]TDV11764.1 putative redox protein [Paraburkholderia caballeronis]TDV14845.1 putative redox protein [Paraburkholderia caballeronis]
MNLATAHAVLRADAPNYVVDLNAGSHALQGDEGPHEGGANRGPTPFEFVLAGLAQCTAATLRMYMQRKAWPAGTVSVDVELHVEPDRTQTIRRTVSVDAALDDSQWTRLAEICEKTPVTLFVKRGTRIDTTMRR